jgi:hypothetical protein
MSSFLCSARPSEEVQVASQAEDRVLEALKKVGAHVDSAMGAFSNLSNLGNSMQTEVVPLGLLLLELTPSTSSCAATYIHLCMLYFLTK